MNFMYSIKRKLLLNKKAQFYQLAYLSTPDDIVRYRQYKRRFK